MADVAEKGIATAGRDSALTKPNALTGADSSTSFPDKIAAAFPVLGDKTPRTAAGLPRPPPLLPGSNPAVMIPEELPRTFSTIGWLTLARSNWFAFATGAEATIEGENPGKVGCKTETESGRVTKLAAPDVEAADPALLTGRKPNALTGADVSTSLSEGAATLVLPALEDKIPFTTLGLACPPPLFPDIDPAAAAFEKVPRTLPPGSWLTFPDSNEPAPGDDPMAPTVPCVP